MKYLLNGLLNDLIKKQGLKRPNFETHTLLQKEKDH